MVELGERLRLGAGVGRHLERHQPLHGALPGQEDAGERPLAQQGEQVEVVDRAAGVHRLHLLLPNSDVDRCGASRPSSRPSSAAWPGNRFR